MQQEFPGYHSYRMMLNRCTNKNAMDWQYYGGRGIRVCKRWRSSFWNFLEDMGVRPDGTSLERIDNNGNYGTDNCTWATRKEQARNKRNNRIIYYKGVPIVLRKLAEAIGTHESTVWSRIHKLGWTPEEAVHGKEHPRTNSRPNN